MSPPPAPLLTPLEALAGAVRVQRRAELARFEAWCRLREVEGWHARDEAVLHLGLSDREVAALDRVADRARALPRCVAAFRTGGLGWSQLVSITYATSRVSGRALAAIDAELASLAGRSGRRADELLDHADRLVREARELRAVERSEDARQHRSRVVVQPTLDGGGVLVADLGPVLFADVTAALDAAADLPHADRDRGSDRAEALGALARSLLTGPGGSRTSVEVLVDLTDAADPRTLGQLLATSTRGRAVRLTALATDVLACDATVRAMLVDGTRPLAERRLAAAVPADVRRAVVARDRGCRWPGCLRPAGWSDVHHLVHRADGGDHDPDNLLVLCRRHHRRLHRPRWGARLDARTAEVTVTDPLGRTTTSTPHGRRLRPAPAGGLRAHARAAAQPDPPPAVATTR